MLHHDIKLLMSGVGMRRSHTPSLIRINGYEYSFRNSREQLEADKTVPVAEQAKKRDHLL
jgi:hypothetical protein